MGAAVGLVLANLALLAVDFTIGDKSAAFMSWGWRLPFVLSAVLIVVALYVRLKVTETPVFASQKAQQDHADRAQRPYRRPFPG